MLKNTVLTLMAIVSLLVAGCSDEKVDPRLVEAENLLFTAPDSTLAMIDKIGAPESESDKALGSLLKVWAQFRLYAKEIDLEALNTAFDYYHDGSDDLRKAQVYYLRGVVRDDQKQGEPEEWAEDIYMGCRAVEKTDDHNLAFLLYQNYGGRLAKEGQYDQAIEWSERALEESRILKNYSRQVTELINLSQDWLYKDEAAARKKARSKDGFQVAKYTDFKHSFDYANKAIDIARSQNMKVEEGKACANIAFFYSRRQDYKNTLRYAIIAKEIDEHLLSQGKIRRVKYLPLAEAYRKLDMGDSAIFYAQKELDNPLLGMRMSAAQQMYMSYRDSKHDYAKASEWLDVFNALRDSVEADHNCNTKAGELNVEKKELTEQMHDANIYIAGVTAFVLVLVLVYVVTVVIMRRRHRRELAVLNDKLTERIAVRNQQQQETNQSASANDAQSLPQSHQVTKVSISGTTKEQLEVAPSDILYIASDGNYIHVYFRKDGKTEQKMLRKTIRQTEEALAECQSIVRCHRAFMVNIEHVVRLHPSQNGLNLDVDGCADKVPVSKTYVKTVRQKVEESLN